MSVLTPAHNQPTMEELSLRSLSQSITAYNSRVQKLSRVQEKLQAKDGNMVTLRNVLKLYQNYKAMEVCCESLLSQIDNVSNRLDVASCEMNDIGEDVELVVGRVNEDYLVLKMVADGYQDYLPTTHTERQPQTYTSDKVTLFCRLPRIDTQNTQEFRAKHPVLALYPNTNRMLPAQVSSPPSRRRKTMDYLVKFPGDAHSVPCPSRFVVDPAIVSH